MFISANGKLSRAQKSFMSISDVKLVDNENYKLDFCFVAFDIVKGIEFHLVVEQIH